MPELYNGNYLKTSMPLVSLHCVFQMPELRRLLEAVTILRKLNTRSLKKMHASFLPTKLVEQKLSSKVPASSCKSSSCPEPFLAGCPATATRQGFDLQVSHEEGNHLLR